MGRSLSGVEREKSEDGDSSEEFFNMVHELKIVGEGILKSLAEHVSDVEQPGEGTCTANETAGNRLRDLKARESEVCTFGEVELGKFDSIWGDRDTSVEVRLKEERLDEQLSSVTEHIEVLEAKLKEVEGLRTNVREKLHEVEIKERDVELMREFLSGKSKEIEMREFEKLCKVEKREKEIEIMHESLSGKLKEVEKREKEIELMRESFSGKLKEVEKREKEAEVIRKSLGGKSKDIEKREKETEFMRESLSRKSKEVDKREKETEFMRKSLSGKLKEVEKREKETEFMRESLSRKLKEVEKREKEAEFTCESLSGKLKEVEKGEKEIEFMRGSLSRKLKEVEKREKEAEFTRESLSGKLKEVEKREKEIELMRESLCGKLKEVAKREKEIDSVRRSLCGKMKEVEKREKDVCVLRGKLIDVEKREREVEDMRESLERQLRGIENREREVDALSEKLKRADKNEKELKVLHQKLCEVEKRVRQVKDMRESLERRLRDVERREREALQEKLSGVEKREREFEDKHRLLDRRLKEAERREKEIEILYEKLKNVEEREREVEVIHKSIDGRFKEIERREIEVEILHEKLKNVEKRAKEVDLAHVSLEGRLKEVENREKEVQILFEKSKDIENLEKVVKTMHESLEKRLREVDERESEFVLSQNMRMKELVSKEQALNTKRGIFSKEVESANEKLKLGSHLIEKLDDALVALDRIKSTVNERFMEMELWEAATYKSLSSILNKAVSAQEIAEKRILELENRERETISSKEKTMETLLRDFLASYKLQRDSICPTRNVELNKEQIDLHLRKCETKHEQSTAAEDARVTIDSVEGIKVKNQEHETKEDVELTGDEINTVLLLSSDAAKLVLEAMQEFYSSHLVKGDVESKLWRKYLLLLDQLRKMSLSIKPCVKEAATKLAVEWKPKVITCAYSESTVLGFLLFFAVYNLLSRLTVGELLTLLKRVAHCKEAPELLRMLCPPETISGFIQNLLNEKQYLLASAYIHECKFHHMFPQSAVLNFFLNQSKKLAKEIRRRGNNSCEAQVEAINLEISHLKAAIKHIKRFGLEFEFSPNSLQVQIKKLEGSRLALTKHLMRSTSVGSESGKSERRSHLVDQISLSAAKNTPSSSAEVSSSSLASDARYSQSGNSRKRLATDSTSEYDRWLLEMNRNTMPHGYYYNARYNRAHKKWRTTNHVPRPVFPHEQHHISGDWNPNL